VRKPEIVGDINTTSIFDSGEARQKHADELAIEQKKDQFRQFMVDDLEPILSRMIDTKNKSSKSKPQSSASVSQASVKAERMKEVHQISMSGVVKEMRQKLAEANFVPASPKDIQLVVEEEIPEQSAEEIEENYVPDMNEKS
jgi:hypothetical protein